MEDNREGRDEERRRKRGNDAVRKCREKKKEEKEKNDIRMEELRKENKEIEQRLPGYNQVHSVA